jgi:multidrug efflux pump subunit AcrB
VPEVSEWSIESKESYHLVASRVTPRGTLRGDVQRIIETVGYRDRVRAPGYLGIFLTLIGTGCPKPDATTPDAASSDAAREASSEWIELRVAAPGMEPAQIETQVLQPIEVAVLSIPRLRHLTAEANKAHARLWLELEPGQRDAVLTDIRARLGSLAPTLPPELDPPVLRIVHAPEPTFVRWAIESETIDASMMGKLNAELVTRVEQLAGVLDIQACAPSSRVVIELEPERLLAYDIEPGEIEAALRGGSSMSNPTMLSLEGLRRTVVASDAERALTVTLADVAAIRYGMRDSTCVAASAAGLVAAASVNVRDRSTAIAVEQLLDEVAAGLPAGVRLRRFSVADTTVELSVAPDRELAEVAESIGSGLVRLAQPWLLEVGVKAEPCVGVGTRVRLSVAGDEPVSLSSFQSIPGVTHVQLLGEPNERRLWLLGPDTDVLHELALREQTRLHALPGLLAVDVYSEAPRAELRIEPDRARLAALGITTAEFARQVDFARGEFEVAVLREADGMEVPVILRVGSRENVGPTQLGGVLIHASAPDTPPVRLDAIANIRVEPGAARICRYDGQRGVVFALQAADPNAWPTLAPSIETALPAGYHWSWAD